MLIFILLQSYLEKRLYADKPPKKIAWNPSQMDQYERLWICFFETEYEK